MCDQPSSWWDEQACDEDAWEDEAWDEESFGDINDYDDSIEYRYAVNCGCDCGSGQSGHWMYQLFCGGLPSRVYISQAIAVRYLGYQFNKERTSVHRNIFMVMKLTGETIQLHTDDDARARSLHMKFMEGDNVTLRVEEAGTKRWADPRYSQCTHSFYNGWDLVFNQHSHFNAQNNLPCSTNVRQFHEFKTNSAGAIMGTFQGWRGGPATMNVKACYLQLRDDAGLLFYAIVWRPVEEDAENPFPVTESSPKDGDCVLILNAREQSPLYRNQTPGIYAIVSSFPPVIEPTIVNSLAYDKLKSDHLKTVGPFNPYQS